MTTLSRPGTPQSQNLAIPMQRYKEKTITRKGNHNYFKKN